MTGIYGDYNNFNNSIYQSNSKKDVEKKTVEHKSNEPIDFGTKKEVGKELGFDALNTSASVYGKAIQLSGNFTIDKGFFNGLSKKEQAALEKELNTPGVASRVSNSAVNYFAAIEGIDEFA